MRRDDELTIPKRVVQSAHNATLPAWVKVKFDFVQQHNGFTLCHRVLQPRIGDGEPARQIKGEGQQSALAVGELVQFKFRTLLLHKESRRCTVSEPGTGEAG